MALDTNC